VGLWNEVKDRLRDRAERLSGGQQQRLCLARTLANQPEVILMDEPCSSLDPAATQQIEELVSALKARYTIVVVTHNLAQARRISDGAIFMLDGEIIEQAPTAQIFMNPQSQLTRDFVSGQIG
jgi:phosphate transport system ATP-binding protein